MSFVSTIAAGVALIVLPNDALSDPPRAVSEAVACLSTGDGLIVRMRFFGDSGFKTIALNVDLELSLVFMTCPVFHTWVFFIAISLLLFALCLAISMTLLLKKIYSALALLHLHFEFRPPRNLVQAPFHSFSFIAATADFTLR